VSPYALDPIRAVGPVRLVLATYPSSAAAADAVRGAVAQRLAARGSVVPVDSTYLRRGEVLHQQEALVLLRTVPKKVGALFEYLGAHHPSEVPEIAEVDVPRVEDRYLRYLSQVLDDDPAPPPLGGGLRRRAARPARGARAPGRTRGPRHRPSR
jgi:periplasmic divalent cation tolerance protein